MRKHACVGCWSSFPTRGESMVWGVAGLAVGAVLISMALFGG